MFIKYSLEGKIALVIVYVDNLVIIGDNYEEIK